MKYRFKDFKPRGPERFTHQVTGVERIIQTNGCHALLYSPGTGKTMTTVDYMSLLALRYQREIRVLVLAPLAATDTWVDQTIAYAAEGVSVYAEVLGGSIRQRGEALASRGGEPYRWTESRKDAQDGTYGIKRAILFNQLHAGGDAALKLCILNYDTFANRRGCKSDMRGFVSRNMTDFMVDAVDRYKPDLIICDEMHKLKGATSNTSKAVNRLVPLSIRRIGLTGTVMPHSPLDVYAQWRFIAPEAFSTRLADGTTHPMSFTSFKNRYSKPGGFMGYGVSQYVRLDEMQAIMSEHSTVADKRDVLDLPAVTHTTVNVDLSQPERNAYRQMKSGLAAQLAGGATITAANRLAMIMRLRQITAGYVPDDNGVLTTLGNSKVRTITSLVNDTLLGEKRVVVFSQFKPEIARLAEAIAREGSTEVAVITGDTPQDVRRAIRKRFGSDDPQRIVLVAQIKTMSLAVNELVTASHAVFASLPQQRDDIEQAIARLDRQGQLLPVTMWWCLVPNSIDNVIYQSYVMRTDMEAAVLKHIQDTHNV